MKNKIFLATIACFLAITGITNCYAQDPTPVELDRSTWTAIAYTGTTAEPTNVPSWGGSNGVWPKGNPMNVLVTQATNTGWGADATANKTDGSGNPKGNLYYLIIDTKAENQVVTSLNIAPWYASNDGANGGKWSTGWMKDIQVYQTNTITQLSSDFKNYVNDGNSANWWAAASSSVAALPAVTAATIPAEWGNVTGSTTLVASPLNSTFNITLTNSQGRYIIILFPTYFTNNGANDEGYRIFVKEVKATGFEPIIPVTAVSITPAEDFTLSAIGQTRQLTTNVVPANAANKNVTWSVEPSGVVTVSQTGLVTAVANGTAVITATTEDGGFTADVKATVYIIEPSALDRSTWTAIAYTGLLTEPSGIPNWGGSDGVWPKGNPMNVLVTQASSTGWAAEKSLSGSGGNPTGNGYLYYLIIDTKTEDQVVTSLNIAPWYASTDGGDYGKWSTGWMKDIQVYQTNTITQLSSDFKNYVNDGSSANWWAAATSSVAALPAVTTATIPAEWGNVTGSTTLVASPLNSTFDIPLTNSQGRYIIILFPNYNTIGGADEQYRIFVKEVKATGVCLWTWKNAVDNNWNNGSNWNYGTAPIPFANVRISSGEDYYPIISSATPKIANLTLEPGAEVGRQDLLTADRVNIAYDFNSKTGRHWLLSSPIKGVYPLDFTFGGYPKSFIQKYETDGWNMLANSNPAIRTALAEGEGFCLWVNAISDNTKGLGLAGGIIRQPFFDVEPAAVHPTYNAATGDFYSYNASLEVNTNDVIATVSRTETGTLPDYSSGGSISFTFGKDNFALLGNPLLSTIDFTELQSKNSSKIKNNYQIWTYNTGTGTGGYATWTSSGTTGIVTGFTGKIAPYQGFFVEKADGANESVTLTFTVADISATGSNEVLRAPAAATDDRLFITATANENSVRTLIARRDCGSQTFSDADASQILDGATSLPVIYTLKPSANDLRAVTANIIDDAETLIPVAVLTNYSGNIKLSFAGMDAFDATITLIDNLTGAQIDLTGLAEYEYSFDYAGSDEATTDRFAVRISKSATAISTLGDAAISVYSAGKSIYAAAASTISKIEVYNTVGQLIYSEKPAATYSTILLNAPAGIYSVRVATADGLKTAKVIVK
jgi:uncharacterized protein YjdB